MSKRYVLLTGAAGGIGRVSIDTLRKAGFSVFAAARPGSSEQSLASNDPEVIVLPLDLAEEASINAAIATVRRHLGAQGRLYALINNAALDYNGPLRHLSSEQIRAMIQVNLLGTTLMTRAALSVMQPGSRIVFVGSAMGLLAVPTVSVYASTKWAMEGLADALRLELGLEGIDVVMVEPGVVQTPMTANAPQILEQVLAGMDKAARSTYEPLMRKIVSMSASPGAGVSADVVADVIAKAVASLRPRSRYRVGSDSRAVGWIRLLPDRLRDWLQRKGLGINRYQHRR